MDTLESSTVGSGFSTEAPTQPAAQPTSTEVFGKGTWYEGVDKTIYEDPSLRAFKDEAGQLNGTNLLKSYVHAQKTMGRDKITVPNPNDAPEAWKEVFSKLGLPKDIKEYNPVPQEYEVENQELFTQFKEIAFQAGILPKQAEQMLQWYAKNEEAQAIAQQEAQTRYYQDGIKALQNEYGQAFDSKLYLAQQAVKNFCSEEVVQMLDQSGLGNDPVVVKFFVGLGELLSEDTNPGTGIKSMDGRLSPAEAQEQINAIMADMTHPYFNKENAQHEDAVRKMNKLFEYLG
jgi:hypothetical protein